MKKLVMILLCVLLVFSAFSCGATDKNDSVPNENEEVSDTQAENAETDAEPDVEEGEEAGDDTASVSEAETLGFGVIDGYVYTNKYAGIGAEFNENWQLQGVETLSGLDEETQQMLEGTAIDEMNGGSWPAQIFDFSATDTTTGNTMNLVYTKLEQGVENLNFLFTEEAMIDTIMQSKDTVISSYAESGIIVESMETVTVTFLGEEHLAVYTVASVSDIPYYMIQLVNYQLGPYGATLTCGSFFEDTTSDMLAMFYVVE